MSRNVSTRLGVAALAAVVSVVVGCSQSSKAPAPGPSSGLKRYDCLIITGAADGGTVVTSSGFPAYYPADGGPQDDVSTPAASSSALLMGTEVRVSVYDVDPATGQAAVAAAIARLAELTEKFNTFKPGSEASAVNRDAAAKPVPVEDDLAQLIRRSREAADLTGGVFDVTVGPLTALWRKSREAGKAPTDEEIAAARELVGFDKVTLAGDGTTTVKFAREGMSLDFGGIAKGFASEEVAKVLARHGVRSAVIACGGNVKLMGARPGGASFRVGIFDPRSVGRNERLRFIVPLHDACIDTSGNYRQFTVIGGRRYSHIVDARTGRSIEALPSVTVVGPDATLCDVLATAIGILGKEEGLKLIDKVNGSGR